MQLPGVAEKAGEKCTSVSARLRASTTDSEEPAGFQWIFVPCLITGAPPRLG